MKGSEDLYPPQDGPAQPAGSEHSREQTLNRIKCALVTTNVSLDLHPESRAPGFDPYDSRMGQPTRDVWVRGLRRR